MNTVELVAAAIAGDKEGVLNSFNAAMADKVTDALELKKVELASNLMNSEDSEETTDEPTEAETEVSGTDDGSEESAV